MGSITDLPVDLLMTLFERLRLALLHDSPHEPNMLPYMLVCSFSRDLLEPI